MAGPARTSALGTCLLKCSTERPDACSTVMAGTGGTWQCSRTSLFHALTLSLTRSLTHSLFLTHTLTLCLFFSLSHTHTHKLSLTNTQVRAGRGNADGPGAVHGACRGLAPGKAR